MIEQRPRHYLAVFLLLLAVVFWGFSFISTKIVLAEIPPASIAWFRQFIAVGVLTPWILIALARGRWSQLRGVCTRDALLTALSGFFGIVLYFVCENTGMKSTTAANASMIVAAVPIFTLFTEAIFFKLAITRRLLSCLALSVAGVYLVVSTGGRVDFSSATFRGNLLVVGAMACWVMYTIVNKKLTAKFSSLLLTYFQAVFSIVLFIPFILPELDRLRPPAPGSLLHLLYLGVCCSALSYIFYVYAVKRLGATISAAFLNLVPVVTVICSRFFLEEQVTSIQLLGMALIVGSLYAISVRRSVVGPAAAEQPKACR